MTTMIAWRKGPCAEFPWSRVAFPRFLVAVRIGRAWLQAYRGTAGQWKVAVCLQRRLDRHGVHPVLGPHVEPCLHVQPATALARPVASPVARAAGIGVQGHLHNAGNGEDHIREGGAVEPDNYSRAAKEAQRGCHALCALIYSQLATRSCSSRAGPSHVPKAVLERLPRGSFPLAATALPRDEHHIPPIGPQGVVAVAAPPSLERVRPF